MNNNRFVLLVIAIVLISVVGILAYLNRAQSPQQTPLTQPQGESNNPLELLNITPQIVTQMDWKLLAVNSELEYLFGRRTGVNKITAHFDDSKNLIYVTFVFDRSQSLENLVKQHDEALFINYYKSVLKLLVTKFKPDNYDIKDYFEVNYCAWTVSDGPLIESFKHLAKCKDHEITFTQ